MTVAWCTVPDLPWLGRVILQYISSARFIHSNKGGDRHKKYAKPFVLAFVTAQLVMTM